MQYACIHAKNTPFATILLSPVMLSIAPGKNVKHIFLQGVTMVSQTVTACLAACAKSPWLGGLRYFVARQTQRDSPGQPQETQTHQTQHHMLTSPLTHDKCKTNPMKLATHGTTSVRRHKQRRKPPPKKPPQSNPNYGSTHPCSRLHPTPCLQRPAKRASKQPPLPPPLGSWC